jgi:hypothetical protein
MLQIAFFAFILILLLKTLSDQFQEHKERKILLEHKKRLLELEFKQKENEYLDRIISGPEIENQSRETQIQRVR